MKRKLISAFLTLAMLFAIAPLGAVMAYAADVGETFTANNSDGVEIKYKVTDAVNLTAEVERNYYSAATVKIPATVSDGTNTYTVTSIGNSAFNYCTNLTSVTIPDKVTSIGNSAFNYCTNLTSVTIPDSVTAIGNSAFCHCTGLTSVMIPHNVTSIGTSAFAGCTSLTSVTIPDNVTSIGPSAFNYCTNLTSVTIPDSVTSIGGNVFAGCDRLAAIYVNAGNPSYTSVDGVLYDQSQSVLLAYPNAKGCAYTIPVGVTSIGDCAFFGCTGLTSVAIPDKVTSIGDSAFESCTALTSVTIPAGVTSIGEYAFHFCPKLASVYFDGEQPSIGTHAFVTNAATTLYYNSSYTDFPASIDSKSCVGKTAHAVTVDAGIANGTVTPSTANGIPGETITLNIAPDSGYALKALTYTDSANNTISINITDTSCFTMPNAAVTIRAAFGKIYTITFDQNGGDTAASPASATVIDGNLFALPTTNPTRAGYTFAGWNTAANGTGTAFTAATPVTGDITVYAQWTANSYTVAYNLDGGANNVQNTATTYTYAGTAITLYAPSKTGYTFGGWYTDSGFTGTAVTKIDDALAGNYADGATINLYAKWTANSSGGGSSSPTTYYTITASAGVGGSISPNGSASVAYGGSKTYTITPTDGYAIKDVLVDGVSVGAVGAYTFKDVKKAHTLSASFSKKETVQPFTDVKGSDWFYDSVMYVRENGMMAGTDSDLFSPNAAMTRQMLWMVLARMDGGSPASMDDAKAWAVENKLSDGSNPGNSITREQLAATLYRYAQFKGYDTAQGGMAIREFTDYDSISEYALPALGWAVNAGLIQGSGNQVMPSGTATRAQVATILMRFRQGVAK